MRSHQFARGARVVVATLVLTSCGGGGKGAPPTSRGVTTPTAPPESVTTAAARWESVTNFSGSAAIETAPFTIGADAIQWRVKWHCDSGALRIESEPPPKKPGPLVDTSSCPKDGEKFSILTGVIRLKVDATGPWTAAVEQQVDTPLAEPPLPGMDSAPVAGAGTFYDIERKGNGTVRLYDLPGGQKALRLDPFEVSQNTELYVWLSEVDEPHTSAEVVAAPHMELALLKSTLGTQNYVLPDALSIGHIGSVVIWCAPVRIAYIAARLAPP